MKCTNCKSDLIGGTFCQNCDTKVQTGIVTQPEYQQHQWVKEVTEILKSLPFLPQKPFLPDAYFYAQYHQRTPVEGLHYMATVLFDWLKIETKGAVIDFYDEKDIPTHKGDTAGFYTTFEDEGEKKEIIFINSKYKDDPMAVGAILAHELMHLYLFRLDLKIENVNENELLTDLATIRTGLAILVLNGMTYSSNLIISIALLFIGMLHWHSEQLTFGYFKPKEYAHYTLEYFKEKNLELKDIIGYINPFSRHFLPYSIFDSKDLFLQKTNSTEYIKLLEKVKRKSIIKQLIIAAIIFSFFIWANISSGEKEKARQVLKPQIDSCKTELVTLENDIKEEQDQLTMYDKQLDSYESSQQIADYNNLVPTRNTLLEKMQSDTKDYDVKLINCNALVDNYNKNL